MMFLIIANIQKCKNDFLYKKDEINEFSKSYLPPLIVCFTDFSDKLWLCNKHEEHM